MKIIYTETDWRKEADFVPMLVTYHRFRKSDWSTDMSGEAVYCGSHQVKRFEVVVEVLAKPVWWNEMSKPYYHTLKRWEFHHDHKNNKQYQARFQVARNWIEKFRSLMREKDYWPLCYALEGEFRRWYDSHFCPELSIREVMPMCMIKPFPSGYGGGFPGRPIPEDRRCDLFKWGESSIPRGVLVDPVSGFDLFDFYRCARKEDLKYIWREHVPATE